MLLNTPKVNALFSKITSVIFAMGLKSIDCLSVHVFMDRRIMLSYRMTIVNELDNVLTEQ